MNIQEGQQRFKARKTPNSEFPSIPPRIESSIDVIYQGIDTALLQNWSAPFADSVVTHQTHYKPGVVAIARLTFETSRWDIYHEREEVRIVPFPPLGKMAEWELNLIPRWDHANTLLNPEPECSYMYDGSYDFSPSRFERLQEDFTQYMITNQVLKLVYNPHLKLYKKPNESEEAFSSRCLEVIKTQSEQEMRTLEDTIQRQIDRLKEKMDREVREIGADELERRNAAPSGKPKEAKPNNEEMDFHESMMNIDDINRELAELEKTRETKVTQFSRGLKDLASQRESDVMRLNRGDIQVMRFSLIWLPYTEFVIQEADRRRMELIQSF